MSFLTMEITGLTHKSQSKWKLFYGPMGGVSIVKVLKKTGSDRAISK